MILSKNAALGQHFLFLPTGIMRKTRMRAEKASPKGKRTRSEMKRSGMSDRGKRGCVCKLEKKKCSVTPMSFGLTKLTNILLFQSHRTAPFPAAACVAVLCCAAGPLPLRGRLFSAHPHHSLTPIIYKDPPNSHLTVRKLQVRSNRLTLLFWPCIMKPPKRTEGQT